MRGGRRPPQTFLRGTRGGPFPSSPLSPGRGVGGVQSIMVDSWFHLVCGNTIPVRSKRSIHCERARGATLRSHPQEPPSGATLRSHPQEPPSGATLRSHPQEPPSGATLEWLLRVSRSPLYTRHIRKY